MAQPPEDIATVPNTELHFNAPFNIQTIYKLRLINTGIKRIAYAFKTTKPLRIDVKPPNGTLGSGDTIIATVICGIFDPNIESTHHDRIDVVWCNAPDPTATKFKLEWFQQDGIVRRKNLPIVYNL